MDTPYSCVPSRCGEGQQFICYDPPSTSGKMLNIGQACYCECFCECRKRKFYMIAVEYWLIWRWRIWDFTNSGHIISGHYGTNALTKGVIPCSKIIFFLWPWLHHWLFLVQARRGHSRIVPKIRHCGEKNPQPNKENYQPPIQN